MSLGARCDGMTHSDDGQDLLNDKHIPAAKLILIHICGGRCAISLRQLASQHRKALIIFQLRPVGSKWTCGDVNVNLEWTKRAEHIYRSAASTRGRKKAEAILHIQNMVLI